MIAYVLSGISFLLAIWYMLSIALKCKSVHRVVFKALPGFAFIGVAISSYVLSESASLVAFIYVLIGLIFGMFGDALLAMRDVKPDAKDKFLLGGIISFGIGHVFYVLFYTTIFEISFLQPLIAIILAVLIISSARLLKLDFKNMIVPVFIYAFIILLMLACSVTALITVPITTATIVLSVGAGLFVISDLILCFIFFKEKVPKVLGIFNLTTYFSAQILIALSLLFL